METLQSPFPIYLHSSILKGDPTYGLTDLCDVYYVVSILLIFNGIDQYSLTMLHVTTLAATRYGSFVDESVLAFLVLKRSAAPLNPGSSSPRTFSCSTFSYLFASLRDACFAHRFLDVPLMLLEHVFNVPTWWHQWPRVVDPFVLSSMVLSTAIHIHKIQIDVK